MTGSGTQFKFVHSPSGNTLENLSLTRLTNNKNEENIINDMKARASIGTQNSFLQTSGSYSVKKCPSKLFNNSKDKLKDSLSAWRKSKDSPNRDIKELKVNKINQKYKEQKATAAINESIDYLIGVFETRSKEQQKSPKKLKIAAEWKIIPEERQKNSSPFRAINESPREMREITKDSLPKVVLNHKKQIKKSIYMQPL